MSTLLCPYPLEWLHYLFFDFTLCPSSFDLLPPPPPPLILDFTLWQLLHSPICTKTISDDKTVLNCMEHSSKRFLVNFVMPQVIKCSYSHLGNKLNAVFVT